MSDTEYFKQRALEERTRADSASSPEVAQVHLALAAKYDALVKKAERRPLLGIAWDDELRKQA